MAAVIICSDFGAHENKVCHCFHCFLIYLLWSNGLDAMIFFFRTLSFKPGFSLSSFIFIKRFLSSSLLSAMRVVSPAYLRLLIFLPAIFISACARKSISEFSSVTQSCLTLCDPMGCSTPGFPVHHQFLELTQTHVHWVGDAIQPSHPLSSPSPPAFSNFQPQGLSQWVSSLHQVAKVLVSASASVLPMNIQDWFPLGWTG